MTEAKSFWRDTCDYAAEIFKFQREDWIVYILWIGLMLGLLCSTSGFILVGHFNGVQFPAYVWNLPVGVFIFVAAIAFDTIGHRTRYKEVLKKGEALVHHITIFAGITSCLALCLAYTFPVGMKAIVIALIALSILYSLIDEALHWHRYLTLNSDRVEMWSHFFILFGHITFISSWYWWYTDGYPGVKETLVFLP